MRHFYIVLLAACAPQQNLDSIQKPTFSDIRPILVRNCRQCHSGGQDWSLYPIAKANSNKIVDRVYFKKDMPKSGFLLEKERKLIYRWNLNGSLR